MRFKVLHMNFHNTHHCWRVFLTALFFVLDHSGMAQVKPVLPNAADLLEPTNSRNWLIIKEGIAIDNQQFINQYKSLLRLTETDELKLLKSETDDYGITHSRYERIYKNYPVANQVLLFHSRGNHLESVNGDIDISIEVTSDRILFSKEESINRAKLFFPAHQYAWQNPQREKEKKEMMHDSKATHYPWPRLVWKQKHGNTKYELCYQVDLVTDFLEAKRLFINAATGELVYSYFLNTECTPTETPTNFYGTRPISTMYTYTPTTGTRYYLWNNCSPAFIRTREMFAGDTTDYYTFSNLWALYTSAATSHWGVQQAAGYFLNVHARQGWNNNNAGCYVYQRPYWQNASGLGGYLHFGEAEMTGRSDDWNSLDIAAHEYAHLVTESSAGLIYEKESGALNESFSDIFGVACYQYNFGFNDNIWKVGYDRTSVTNANNHLFIRDMENPNTLNDPDTYQGTNWVNTNVQYDPGDYWGVHTNSGVQNFMFYLLIAGGAGTNDHGHTYYVESISIVDARRIAYQALTAYLGPNSNHADARNAWVQAARNIFGSCSYQAIRTGKAWDAVGLPPPVRTFNYVGNYTGVYNLPVSGTANLSTPSAMTIQPGAQVTVTANLVRMLPGFKAFSGSYFRAGYGDCFYSAL